MKNLTWQNPEQLFVAQELINKVKSKCCGIKDNYILKCFLLIDLKTTQISHQDVGQMDMYVRMYDELKRTDGDNPTIGLILCSKTSEDMAKYSILKENKQLFQAKYLTYLPTEEQLRHEIERQKEIFMQQQANKEQDR